jgi:uncharacterized protein (TIGR02452 family)
MAKRASRAATAQETLRIQLSGGYTGPAGQAVSIAEALASARDGSVLYTPRRLKAVVAEVEGRLRERGGGPTAVEVVNEPTLRAARRLLAEGCPRVVALNFASARNPGGGFLKGSEAQEESLARASGLYACISPLQEMYDANRRCPTCLYTDHLIYSPDVPVFRDGDDALLAEPWALSFITAPAVNAGVVRSRELDNVPQIEPVMLARIENVLAVAAHHGHDAVVLGAWGCGVFANDPEAVAGWFARHLTGEGLFASAFRRVVFAVLDRSAGGRTFPHFTRLLTGPSGR